MKFKVGDYVVIKPCQYWERESLAIVGDMALYFGSIKKVVRVYKMGYVLDTHLPFIWSEKSLDYADPSKENFDRL